MTTQTETESSQHDVVKSFNKTPFINRKRVKDFALEYCKRSPKTYLRDRMKRVSGKVYLDLDAKVREWIRQRCDSQPSMGKTIM